MAQTGSTTIEEIYKRQVAVVQAVEQLRKTGRAERVAELEKDLVAALVEVRKGGDLVTIMEAERALLREEYEQFTNTAAMKGSLETALEEMDAALATVAVVADPDAYRVRVDEMHRVRKRRIGDVPRDDARVFFRGHRARLSNLEKARGTDNEKAVIVARGASMRVAEKIYTSMQREALGIGDIASR